MVNIDHMIMVLLVNLPAYFCAALALWRKRRDESYYAAFILAILMGLLLIDAVCVSQIFYIETAAPLLVTMQAVVSVLIVPFIYLFLAPEGGEDIFANRTTVFLFALTLLLLLPSMSWDLMPRYSTVVKYVEPQKPMGVSIFWKGEFLYHLTWMAIILILQSYIALTRLNRLYKLVLAHGAHYSWKAKGTYYWNFGCGYFLALSFLIPLEVWQHTSMRWVFYVMSSLLTGVGCLFIYLGFDLNPVVNHESSKNSSLSDFMLENGDLVERMKQIVEEERVYLETGIQSETVAQRLETSLAYFLKMFNATYGCSFPEWVNRQRIAHSKELLQAGYSFERTAAECGFSGTFAFLRVFMRISGGETASEYCRSLGQKAPIYRPKEAYDDDE